MFCKQLQLPVVGTPEKHVITDKLSLVVGIAHLAVCTVLLSVSSYIGLKM